MLTPAVLVRCSPNAGLRLCAHLIQYRRRWEKQRDGEEKRNGTAQDDSAAS
jgi:hypothetical protein